MVASVIQMQRSLPVNVEDVVNRYLQANPIDIRRVIQGLRVDKLSEIASQSQEQNAVHHSLMHAHEVKVRVMAIINEDLKIYCSDSDFDVFMRNIIALAVECHDLIQGAVAADGATVEKRSADLVLSWLNSEEGLGVLPDDVMQILRYLIYYVIPIATTIAFSVNKPMDLTSLLNLFETYFKKAGLITYHPDNQRFCKITKLIANIIGCIDTIPYAMLQSNIRQCLLSAGSSFAILGEYRLAIPYAKVRFNEGGILHRFMRTKLKKYFSKNVSNQYDYQAFLTGLVAKIGMRVELANGETVEGSYAKLLGAFIRNMQFQYLQSSNLRSFLQLFDREFEEYFLGNSVDILFMRDKKIQAEKEFVNSNYERACLTRMYIDDYISSEMERRVEEGSACPIQPFDMIIIDPKAIRADAENIESFFNYYKGLRRIEDKLRLVKELTLNIVTQVGATYIKKPATQNLLDPQNSITFPNLSDLDNYQALSLNTGPGIFTDVVRQIVVDTEDENTGKLSMSRSFMSFTGRRGVSGNESKDSEGGEHLLGGSFLTGK